MILKAIDLALMSEHLTTHKGVLSKLHDYYCSVKNPILKQIIYNQFLIMRNHVQVMLMLMDPNVNERVSVSSLMNLQPVNIPCQNTPNMMSEKEITIEARHTAMSMASDNFSSALRMKAENVRDIHVQMAIQQVKIQEQYSDFMKKMDWEHAPDSSPEVQLKTLNMFKELYDLPTT